MARHYTDASSVQKFAKAQISGRNISCASTTKASSVVNVTWCFQLNQRDRHTNIGSTRLKLCATTVVERTLEINKRGTFYGTIPQTKKGPFNAYYVTQSRALQLNKLMMTITTFIQVISKCDQCPDVAYASSGNLFAHIRATHKGKKRKPKAKKKCD